MPEETNPASSPPSETEAKQPKTRKVARKPRPVPEENKLQQEAKAPKPDLKPDRDAGSEDPGKSTGNGKPQEGKRPNRRRRGKGKTQGKDPEKDEKGEVAAETDGSPSGIADKREPKELPASNAQRPPQKPRRNVDPGKLAKNAWKIYLAEVSEEGVALIGDNDARELARRCFRLAEIFLEEEDRRS
jgi:hypothetical protein